MAQVIGQAIDRIDGRAKVTGTAAYAADNRADRMAFGSIVGATIARGRVAGIDANAAQRMPGVLLVMTHENAPKQAPFQAKAAARQRQGPVFRPARGIGRGRDGGDRARRRLRDRRHLREGQWRLRSRIGQR